MKEKNRNKISKTISYWLRHHPEKINLKVYDNGWVYVKDLIEKSTIPITIEDLKYIASNGDKKRFSFNDNFTKIRACQGHTIKIKMEFEEIIPDKPLYHGTQKKHIKSILKEGLKPMRRHHVHLSKDIETAKKVGLRKGKELIVLEIDVRKMRADRYKIYKSENDVYLTDIIPSEYIKEVKL